MPLNGRRPIHGRNANRRSRAGESRRRRTGAGPASGGEQAPHQPNRWWLLLALVAMLALNLASRGRALGPAERVRIPYQPTFLNQIRDGNVRSISSKGTAACRES